MMQQDENDDAPEQEEEDLTIKHAVQIEIEQQTSPTDGQDVTEKPSAPLSEAQVVQSSSSGRSSMHSGPSQTISQ